MIINNDDNDDDADNADNDYNIGHNGDDEYDWPLPPASRYGPDHSWRAGKDPLAHPDGDADDANDGNDDDDDDDDDDNFDYGDSECDDEHEPGWGQVLLRPAWSKHHISVVIEATRISLFLVTQRAFINLYSCDVSTCCLSFKSRKHMVSHLSLSSDNLKVDQWSSCWGLLLSGKHAYTLYGE